MVKVKICGITSRQEALWLNEADVDYAGFVFYSSSKRNISIRQASLIAEKLNGNIKKVAVTVSPELRQIEALTDAGFDILQVHGKWDDAIVGKSRIPVWRALNVTDLSDQYKALEQCLEQENAPQAVVVDAGSFGSGKTFGWEENAAFVNTIEFQKLRRRLRERDIWLILAGGLNVANVKTGIRLFAPEIVDVSTGVEADTPVFTGKSKKKIEDFCRLCRNGGKDE